MILAKDENDVDRYILSGEETIQEIVAEEFDSLDISVLGIPLYPIEGTSTPLAMKLLGTRNFTTLHNEASRHAEMIDSGVSYNFATNIMYENLDPPTSDTPDLLVYQGYGYQMLKGCANE